MNERPGSPLEGRLVVLGVTGSIAAYKAAEIVRAFVAEGADVQVLMTPTAARFIGPLTMETLSRRPVMLDPLELLPDRRIGHIVAADAADVIVVAPATARWLGAMANGLADDVVTATCLASTAPVIIAPAMDGEMYAHPATRANVDRLRGFGYTLIDPEVGSLASGQSGHGRLAGIG
ncbi:MAG: phosphopantothenoylcysteine decarboxylase, partial [Chloroflexi bacterium]|nr:phosphopantothenoylcysteine decarboxylase [Chloroflexota bacterium]